MPDRLFSLPLLAELYDVFDPVRRDLDFYLALLHEFRVRSMLDIGCGTGTLALRLADRGFEVIGVDLAEASLDVAKRKPGADRVRWIIGDACHPVQVSVDAATMTGNVAQVFLTDQDWMRALRSAHRVLRPGGYLIFETRDPAAQAWRRWNRGDTYRAVVVEGKGEVACWEEVTGVEWPMISFQTTFVFARDNSVMTSASTLRFRSRSEIVASLLDARFEQPEVRDAPDRPGLEFVFIARRSVAST